MSRTTLIAALAVLLLALPGFGMTVYLKGGQSLDGEVVALSEKAVTLELDGIQGSRLDVPLRRISDYSLYQIRRNRTDRQSPEAVEALGDWAMSRGLLTFAMEEYAAALNLRGKEAPAALRKKLADASSRCAADKLARAKALENAGELEDARRFLMDILKNHPSCPAAEKARGDAARLKKLIQERKEEAARKAEEERAAGEIESAFARVQDLVRSGDSSRRLGLMESGSLGKAEDDFLAAIRSYRRGASLVSELRKKPASRAMVARMDQLDALISRKLGDAYVDLGHNYVVKGNLVKANRYMGLALALDPNDPKALALRQAIAMATANDRWGRSGWR